MIGKVFPVLK